MSKHLIEVLPLDELDRMTHKGDKWGISMLKNQGKIVLADFVNGEFIVKDGKLPLHVPKEYAKVITSKIAKKLYKG